MASGTYEQRRSQLEVYFDRTAADAWARLTSTARVSRIRQTVREGRDRMRQTLLDWLPADLRGKRLLDAGCGTGALSVEAARRGAEVVAVDLAENLVSVARTRMPDDIDQGQIRFQVGDMLDPAFGVFDYAVCMDSLIHYTAPDMVASLEKLFLRTSESVLFTFAPKTPALAALHALGLLFPQGNRAPAIEPVSEASLTRRIRALSPAMRWQPARTQRIKSGFYTSQAMELIKK